MTSLKELRGKINPVYDEALSGINDNDSMPVIIWGASKICRQLINYFNGKRHVIIWDSKTHGNSVKGYPVIKPQFDLADEIKQNAYVIMAFTSEKNYVSCGKLLEDSGYRKYINGEKFLEHITASMVLNDYKRYNELNKDPEFEIQDSSLSFRTDQKFAEAGASFYDTELLQCLWGAKRVYENMPSKHYDIGSSVKTFITSLLSFGLDTVLIDIRPLETGGIENLTFLQSDAMELHKIESGSIESLSTLSVAENIGLGRYNDSIDPEGHLKFIASIQRVMKEGGNLYLSTTVSDRNYLLFNMHRVFRPDYIVEKFDKMKLVEFSIASGTKGLLENQPLDLPDLGDDCGYYIGLFHFRKM